VPKTTIQYYFIFSYNSPHNDFYNVDDAGIRAVKMV
jgi:hypothetical protein